MKYAKPSLTYEQQADLVLSRGLATDRQILIERLRAVGYYRLSAYWHPFKRPDDTFAPGTTLDTVWQRYTFDRQLRLMVMDAIERVEVAIRSALITNLTLRFGPFAHLDPRAFPGINPDEHRRLLDDLRDGAQRSSEVFVEHFKRTYDDFPDLPLWAAAEIMTFGNMFTLFRISGKHTQKALAQPYGVTGKVLFSWLLTLNYVRNLCAHHARLWNRELALKPLIPDAKHDPRWYGERPVGNNRIFAVLTIHHFLLLRIAPQSGWRDRLFLFSAHLDHDIRTCRSMRSVT
ncbi:MAG: Abi family protein [Candidatus Peribacteraceae bacterium]